jgi:hypothetical protein
VLSCRCCCHPEQQQDQQQHCCIRHPCTSDLR